MRLLIIRHGESEWNRQGLYQGQYDAPLSELGLRQADALGQRLANEPIFAMYTSPLQRAAKTAEAVARYHPDAPFHTETALLEINHGQWEGLTSAQVEERFGAGLQEWRVHPTRAQMPDGESFSNILKRVLDFRDQLYEQYPEQNILVSTHDVVVKILVADALGMNMDRINRIWVTNASISVIEYGNDLPYLVSLSEACHLGRLETVRNNQKAL
ncbi:MAG: histidine phosphatase family protein [Chloroflexi bacterium AL-W]|nr:histidine phosphatase family protein [Chloroflexi bacterium AL-N1]NOK67590.1 histidine phosphatase family protein [Chloroflexi bacterium AL-N10]NOK75640.1 histidine phosphatase family protein [Chloroflexi bacterium AL-N5]NOK82428.1 histidine phosphatase family protein [Chloroflexi bacterium AL-W]NOK90273.1 histidine phosphatase family protein [Chloroflexi bacterium AL-N15]